MYKITFTGSIKRLLDNTFIPPVSDNRDYQQFVDDIYTNGIGIVEGADYVGVTTYTEARAAEYPPLEEQLDKIYHSGIDAWKADIKVIKDKYPKTQVGITSIAPIPEWVKTALFDRQKEEYIKAKARLAQHELANGLRGYVSPNVFDYIIKPLPLWVDGKRNPKVVQDEEERIAAQIVINNTPQAVIDSINT
jgi:hypothetical protein